MNITSMEIDFQETGKSKVWVNVVLHTQEEIDDLIAWLELAKATMVKWEEIRS